MKSCVNCKEVVRGMRLLCGRCGTVCYCNRSCQLQDWPTHRSWCFVDSIKRKFTDSTSSPAIKRVSLVSDKQDDITVVQTRSKCQVRMKDGLIHNMGNKNQPIPVVVVTAAPACTVVTVQSATKFSYIDEKWACSFQALLDYGSCHLDCNVPRDHKPLGRWLISQRSAKKNGSLNKDRADRLQSLVDQGLLSWFNRVDYWEDYLERLIDFQCTRKYSSIPDGALGRWLEGLRKAMDDNSLSATRKRQVELLLKQKKLHI